MKELIPEFFYMPEFLENQFNLDLGEKQSGEKVIIPVQYIIANLKSSGTKIQVELLVYLIFLVFLLGWGCFPTSLG